MTLSERLFVADGGVHLPIMYGRHKASPYRRSDAGQIAVGGLGDYEDMWISPIPQLKVLPQLTNRVVQFV